MLIATEQAIAGNVGVVAQMLVDLIGTRLAMLSNFGPRSAGQFWPTPRP